MELIRVPFFIIYKKVMVKQIISGQISGTQLNLGNIILKPNITVNPNIKPAQSTETENKYIIGSHNAVSYLKIEKWYMRPFGFIAKCQDQPIVDQIKNEGIRCLDMRVRLDKKGNWKHSHGKCDYTKSEEIKNSYNTKYISLANAKNYNDDIYYFLGGKSISRIRSYRQREPVIS